MKKSFTGECCVMIAQNRILYLPLLGLAAFILVILFQFWDVNSIPFHPDESTQLYMSSDFQKLLHSPGQLAWTPENPDPRAIYRLLDAPLSRYLIGFGLSLSHLPPLPADWDWSNTWADNDKAGAVPVEQVLKIGRLVTTSLIPLSMLFLFLTGRALGGKLTGWLAGILLGLNMLVLLHGRRAMAESALLMCISLALWGFLHGDRYPWLAGLGAALAFNAKQSALALAPIGLLSVIWIAEESDRLNKKRLVNILQFCGVYLAIFLLLNPFVWKHPIPALQASWQSRQDLLFRQVNESLSGETEQNQLSIARRSLITVANLYIIPPQFYEVGNYRSQIESQENVYLAGFGHQLGRGILGGGLLFLLTLAGIVFGFRSLNTWGKSSRRNFLLLFLAMVLQVVALIIWVPLPWQRYVIPLVPYACIWPAFAFQQISSMWGKPG